MPSSACDWSSDVCSSDRSEEHTSELQSRSDLVCRLLLEKKKNKYEKQSLSDLLCRLLLEKTKQNRDIKHHEDIFDRHTQQKKSTTINDVMSRTCTLCHEK